MPSALDTLIGRIADEQLRAEIRAAVGELRKVTDFGLVFEAHIPETVRLPDHPIRRGIKVTLRDLTDQSMFEVVSVDKRTATLRRLRLPDGTNLSKQDEAEIQTEKLRLSSLVALAEFGDAIYPGMRHLGSVQRGAENAAHVVIKGENHHVLEALQFTQAGKIDCIYIDPPYNSGARDWKYNNHFVDGNDAWRHSKWLAMMDRRLKLAKHLLRSDASVLLVTIDDNEVYSLGLLLDQIFRGCERQLVSITISPRGKSRADRLSQVDEYLVVTYIGSARIAELTSQTRDTEVRWRYLRRNDIESARGTAKGGPSQFYPIYVNEETERIVQIGDPLPPGVEATSAPRKEGAVAVLPIREDGVEMNWGLTGPSLRRALDDGYVRVTRGSHPGQAFTIAYLTGPNIRKVKSGTYVVTGAKPDGSKVVMIPGGKVSRPTTAWRETRYDAGEYGTGLLGELIPGRKFPFPKSLYAVEDTLPCSLEISPTHW